MPIDCPRCSGKPLSERLGPFGALVDFCGSCSGVWLDKGEVYLYVKDQKKLQSILAEAYKAPTGHSKCACARCAGPMYEVKVPGAATIDVCGKCGATWFDAGEVRALGMLVDGPTAAEAAKPAPQPSSRVSRVLPALPSLGLRSAVVLGGLYAVLMGFFALLSVLGRVPIGSVFVWASAGMLLSFLVNPFLLDLSLRWMHGVRWVPAAQLKPELAEFLNKACAAEKIPVPSIGIIEDGTPNAFTYGHVPSNARLVLTRGILDMLDQGELEAVVGHELGHVVHWDMLIMTAAALVPLVLREIYESCRKMMKRKRPRSSGGKKGGDPIPLIMVVSLVLYWITRYVVLFLSRTRELHADRYSGELTRRPNDLSSALVKIAYGLAGKTRAEAEEDKNQGAAEAIGPLGVFDETGAMALVAARPGQGDASAAMGWDLYNPWATYFELHSSHPLPAKRIDHLSRQAESYGQKPFAPPPAPPGESLLDEFAIDLLIMWLPWIMAAFSLAMDVSRLGGGAVSGSAVWGHAGVGWAVGQLIRLQFSYPTGSWEPSSAAAMLKRLKVSGVRGIPVELRGTVIGRGQPGYVFSEDFAIQDPTGYLLVDYKQPMAIFQLIFALGRVRNLIGKPVVVRGWYRRAPVPYLELRELSESPSESGKCWSLEAQYVLAFLVAAFSVWAWLG